MKHTPECSEDVFKCPLCPVRRTERACFEAGRRLSRCSTASPARTPPAMRSGWSSARKKGTMTSWVSCGSEPRRPRYCKVMVSVLVTDRKLRAARRRCRVVTSAWLQPGNKLLRSQHCGSRRCKMRF